MTLKPLIAALVADEPITSIRAPQEINLARAGFGLETHDLDQFTRIEAGKA